MITLPDSVPIRLWVGDQEVDELPHVVATRLLIAIPSDLTKWSLWLNYSFVGLDELHRYCEGTRKQWIAFNNREAN